jgi:hypothetical protein
MSTTNGAEEIAPPELDNLVKLDPYLTSYQGEIKRR